MAWCKSVISAQGTWWQKCSWACWTEELGNYRFSKGPCIKNKVETNGKNTQYWHLASQGPKTHAFLWTKTYTNEHTPQVDAHTQMHNIHIQIVIFKWYHKIKSRYYLNQILDLYLEKSLRITWRAEKLRNSVIKSTSCLSIGFGSIS